MALTTYEDIECVSGTLAVTDGAHNAELGPTLQIAPVQGTVHTVEGVARLTRRQVAELRDVLAAWLERTAATAKDLEAD